MTAQSQAKIIGIGLNKTATKSLRECLLSLGYHHQTYSLDAFHLYQAKDWAALFAIMDEFSSFEDWPWPLMYKEIEQRYPNAKFVLTTRASADIWYRSLCKMAVRMGPLNDFERHIYGYAMPQGKRQAHIDFYHQHNHKVRQYFKDKPGKLMELCFDEGVDKTELCQFLDKPVAEIDITHTNKSERVYEGDCLWFAHLSRVKFQSVWHTRVFFRALKQRLRQTIRRAP